MFDDAWQDSANNTYHTLNRDLSPTQGRWLTPDPAGMAAVDPTNPQSWNRYAYVTNNPVSMIDPLGLNGDDGGGGDDSGGGTGGEYNGSFGGTCLMCGTSNYGQLLGKQALSFFGTGSFYDIPGNSGFGSNGAQQEARYVSIITNGWDPVLQQHYSDTTYWFTDANGNNISNAKTIAAIAFGQQACSGMGAGDVASCIQQTYDTMGDPVRSEGGHDDFSVANVRINGQPVNPNDFGCLFSRCGFFNSLDYSHGDYTQGTETFHVDMANPWFIPVGSGVHLFGDVIGGNTWWSGGVPPFPFP